MLTSQDRALLYFTNLPVYVCDQDFARYTTLVDLNQTTKIWLKCQLSALSQVVLQNLFIYCLEDTALLVKVTNFQTNWIIIIIIIAEAEL